MQQSKWNRRKSTEQKKTQIAKKFRRSAIYCRLLYGRFDVGFNVSGGWLLISREKKGGGDNWPTGYRT